MAIGLISNTILRPYCSSSSSSDDDDDQSVIPNDVLVPLTIFDKAAFDLHVAVLYAFNPPMPSNEVLKEALSKVLVHYPHLAGRFTTDNQGRTCIILNNAGVRVTETYLPTTLAKQLPFHPSKDVSHLLPSVEGIEELCQIQLNRYACGGLVIGLTSHHRVADGQSMSSFFVAWAKFVRGLDVDPLPYHDRFAISVPRNPPKVEFDHNSIEFKKTTISPDTTPVFSSSIETLIIHYSTEFTNKLKAKVVEENNCNPHQRFSTFECLLSHAWKKVTQARGLDLEECTQVRVAVNGRARIKPAVPMEYFGNLVLWAYPKLKVKEVLNESHAYIAKAIHDEVARVDDKYFKSFIDFGEIKKGDEGEELEATAPEFGNTLCPNLEVDSWLRFQFHDLDFGGGGPCAFFPPNIPVEGLLIFLPSCKEVGGVDLVLSLLPEHVELFKQISHSMD
ncbi:Transferase [Macleaya cordata]|uniref:Transferase n=1 Tax=Macleaya cordata TaxID=56857 RepID=A0A200QM38_MACCD|nr:Transferase [Macleaya cordata]